MKKNIIILLCTLSLNTYSILKIGGVGNKSIYNLDDREIITKTTDASIQELSKSVAMIFYEDDLVDKDTAEQTSTIFSNLLSLKPPMGYNYCPSEKFGTHVAYKRGCTGFLIGKDILVTAGHCFKSKNDCHRKLIAFSVTENTEAERGFKISNSNIYSCSKILFQEYNQTESFLDFAIIQLDRKTDRKPLKFRQAKQLESEDGLFMIGHPLGLPMTYAPGGKIIDNTNDIFFRSSLDSFHGNSGSPVFNSNTNIVEGILVRGESDEKYNHEKRCNEYATYSEDDQSKGEGVTRITTIIPYIFNKLNPEDIN